MNTEKSGWEGKASSYSRKATNKSEKKHEIRRSPFGNHHPHNRFREGSLMDTKSSGWQFNEDYLYTEELLIKEGQMGTWTWRNV